MMRGSAVVEFAIVFPLVVLALVAAVEIAIAARAQIEVVAAAREGARHAAADPDPAGAAAAVRAALGEAGDEARVSIVRPQVVGAGAEVTVRVPHRLAAPLLGGITINLTGRAVMRVER